MSLLHVRGLGKSFGGVDAVDQIDFELDSGELLALIGPNGAGKSTTFNMLNGQLCADRGSILLDGQELIGRQPREIWRLGVSRTFQIAETFSSLTVLENVQMAVLSRTKKIFSFFRPVSAYPRAVALDLLSQLGMADQALRPCNTLAYSDIKRVELAMALASAPRLLLMDEPTAGMAPQERRDLMALTKKLVLERNIAVLFTEHSMDVVFAHADRMIVLARGRLIAQGRPAEIRQHPQVQEVYFGSGSTFSADFSAVPVSKPLPADPLLEVRELSAWYGAAQVLSGVDLQVRRGEVVALMGRNGSGKSSTLKAIIGLLEKCHGEIRWRGRDIAGEAPHRISASGLGFVPEDRRIFTDLTVLENLDVARQGARFWPDGRAVPVWTIEKIFALFPSLAQMPDRPGGRMSGGEQQMLAVARTLMGNPYLVLLDEPSEGLAPVIIEQMVDMIRTLKTQGVSILLSEQNLSFASLVCDRAYVLEKGEICFSGSMQDLLHDAPTRQAYLGI